MLPVVLPVALAGTALAGTAVGSFADSRPPPSVLLAVLALLAASVLAEALPVPIEGVRAGPTSLANIFIVGSCVLYGWEAGVFVAFGSMLLVELVRSPPPIRIAYNTALYGLAGGAAGSVAALRDGTLFSLSAAALGASAAFYVVDIALLAAVVARSTREAFVPLAIRYVRSTALPFGIMASVTVLLVVVWDQSALLAVALVGPLAAIALYQRSVHRALEAMRLARTDPLTGLGNHRDFYERVDLMLEEAKADGSPLSLCVIDVDDFKQINDTHGHPVGDAVLVEIAAQLRRGGEAYRLGGDEFAILLRRCGEERALEIAESVLERVSAHTYPEGSQPSISAGVATYPHHALDRTALLRLADRALYSSKQQGKTRAQIYAPELAEPAELRQLAEGPDRAARLRAAASLAQAVDARDTYTGSHSYTVGQLAARIAERLELDTDDVELVRLAGKLHDLGKLAIPEEILRKPGPLDPAERLVIQRHPEIGFRMLDSLGIDPIGTWVLHHHERWDGGGYPEGLRADEIPLGSRIILVADAYDAMTSDRIYRGRLSHRQALRELEGCAGTQFDPAVVAAFKAELDARLRPVKSA